MASTWRKLPLVSRAAVLLAIAVAGAALVLVARRDLSERDASLVRGDPEVWKRVTVMPGAAAAYLVAGRRRPQR